MSIFVFFKSSLSRALAHFLFQILMQSINSNIVVSFFQPRRRRRCARNKAGIFQNIRQGACVHSVKINKMLQAWKFCFPPVQRKRHLSVMQHPYYLSVDNLAMGREGEHVATVQPATGADEKDPIRGPVWKKCQVRLLPAKCWSEPGFSANHCGKWLVCPLQAGHRA